VGQYGESKGCAIGEEGELKFYKYWLCWECDHFFIGNQAQCKDQRAMMKKYSLSKPQKIDILKRLIKKYSTSGLSKQETICLLKRFVFVLLER